jgi:polyphosphate glucokinase
MEILGIDIGGSGIKGAPVDVGNGVLTAERYRLPTPSPSHPDAVADTVSKIVKNFGWHRPIGATFPAVVKSGVVRTAANVHAAWIGTDGASLFQEKTGCPVTLINDADAAGLAEMAFGAGQDNDGVVIMVTLGTGIGVSIFTRQVLLPNVEVGHIEIDGKDAEFLTSDRIRQKKDLSWKQWGRRVNIYLRRLEALFSPDLFIIGGGVSKKHQKFFPEIQIRASIVPALLLNEAGIVGAALAARERSTDTTTTLH